MFDGANAVTMTSPRKGYEVMSDEEYEEYKQYKKDLVKRLWALKEASHKEGQRYLSDNEFYEMWADERAGGEGVGRLWNY